MERNQKILNWIQSEKNKDLKELEQDKLRLIKELKTIKKEGLFVKPEKPKMTLWKKIKLILLGS
jgi:hypothetical protein